MLRIISNKPTTINGMPISAPMTVAVKKTPMIRNTSPRIKATNLPVNSKIKVISLQIALNGDRSIFSVFIIVIPNLANF
jgi:hypothetical protein